MEDYFQIIFIVIFIIASIISSLNKKKKQQAKLDQTESTNLSQKQVPVARPQKPANKMLEELLGFKIEIPEPPQREAPVNYSENLDTWDPSKEYETQVQDGVSDFQAKNAEKKNQASQDRMKYQAFKEEIVKAKPVKKITKRENILLSHSKLKDYIIIQELLNKPKALRR